MFHRGTVEDTELVDGLVLNQRTAGGAGLSKVEKAKIGLIQFCISPPKTDVSLSPMKLRDFSKLKGFLRVFQFALSRRCKVFDNKIFIGTDFWIWK